MAVQLADEFAAVLVAEVQRDVAGVEFEHIPRVPAEVVAGGGVEVDVAEAGGASDAVPVVGARRTAADYSPRLLLRQAGSVQRGAERGGGLVSRDDLTIAAFRDCGRMLRQGVGVRVPQLPRTRRTRMILQLEADRDPLVKLAFEVALGQTPTTERARQVAPRVLRRDCGTILEIR